MAYKEIFFTNITATDLLRTIPASSIVNPAAMNITMAPQMSKKNVFNKNPVSKITSTVLVYSFYVYLYCKIYIA